MFDNIFLIFIFDLVRKIMQNPNRKSYTCMKLNALKIHRAKLPQAELTQGRLDSGADLTSGQLDPLPIRLRLKKKSDQGLPCLLFWQTFCEFLPIKYNQYLIWKQKEKSNRNRTSTVTESLPGKSSSLSSSSATMMSESISSCSIPFSPSLSSNHL